jgi:hypothetical protein
MTVNSMKSRVVHTGDGATTSFAISFSFQSERDLFVTQTEAGVDTPLALTQDYTTAGVNDDEGTLLLKTAPQATQRITVFRDPSLLRTISYPAQNPIPAVSLEPELDRPSMVDQAQDTHLWRALRFAINDDVANPLPAASARANGYLAFDGAGNPVVVQAGTAATSGQVDCIRAGSGIGVDHSDPWVPQVLVPNGSLTEAHFAPSVDAHVASIADGSMKPARHCVYAIPSTSGSVEIDPLNGAVQSVALTANTTFILKDWPENSIVTLIVNGAQFIKKVKMFDSDSSEFWAFWTPNTDEAKTRVINIFYNGVSYNTWFAKDVQLAPPRPIIIAESATGDSSHATGTPEDTLVNNGKFVVHGSQGNKNGSYLALRKKQITSSIALL